MKKIIIVKIGRSIATSKRNKVDRYRFEQLAKQIKMLQQHNISVVLVVSAAVCCGEQELRLNNKCDVIKQLVGGVGQATVVAELYSIFTKHKLKMGQLLVTKHDLKDGQKRNNVAVVLRQAAELDIVMVINENDIVELHSFGGNDYLATEIAKAANADELLLLTDVDGVFDEKMQVIENYTRGNNLAQIKKITHKGEVGGMRGKLAAALLSAEHGITTWIANGKTTDILSRMFLQHEHIGTQIGGAL